MLPFALPKVTLGECGLTAILLWYFFGRTISFLWIILYVGLVYYRFTLRPKPLPPVQGSAKRDPARDGFTTGKIPERVDAIVIGSGVGGLYTAAFLAKTGKSVLVLEQHYIAGGTTHCFTENGFEFDTGVHYVNNYKIAQMMLAPVQHEAVKFAVMGDEKDGYTHDNICLGDDYSFACRKGTIFADMAKEFPHDKKGIKKLRKIVDESQIVLGIDLVCKTLPKFIWRVVKNFLIPVSWWRHIERGGNELVGEYVKDKKLQGILLGRYGDMGGPPDQVSMSLHVAIAEAFAQDGGAYPVGGPAEFAKSLIPTIEKAGGRVLVRAPVEKILLENYDDHQARKDIDYDSDDEPDDVKNYAASRDPKDNISSSSSSSSSSSLSQSTRPLLPSLHAYVYNLLPPSLRAYLRRVPLVTPKVRAVGVRVKGVDVYAPLIISNAGAWNTYARLLPRPLVKPWGYLDQMRTAQPSVSHVFAFIGLKGEQKDLNLPSANYWCMDVASPNYDVQEAATSYFKDPLHGKLCFFFGFPSAKDPEYNKRNPGKSVCLAFAETTIDAVKEWKNSVQGRRDADYEEYKEMVGKRMVDAICKRMPHLKGLIENVDYATPLTNVHYLNSAHGESLGIRNNPYRLSANGMDFVRPATPVDGLYLTGQDAAIPGVFGAMLGGLLCSQTVSELEDVIANFDFFKQLPGTYVNITKHFIKSKKEVIDP